MTDAPERIWLNMSGQLRTEGPLPSPQYDEYIRTDLAGPAPAVDDADLTAVYLAGRHDERKAAPAVCCLGLTPEQCAHAPSSQCKGLRPAVDPLSDPRVVALVEAANMLAICAQTTGGTAGPDKELQQTIADYAAALAALEGKG